MSPRIHTMPRLTVLLLLALAGCAADHPVAAGFEPRPSAVSDSTSTSAAAVTDAGATTTAVNGTSADAGTPDATVAADAEAPPIADTTPACLGDTAPSDAVACPTNGACSEACARVAAHYRPGVAAFVAACIAKLDACDDYGVIGCVDQAAARACPSDLAKPFCADFVTRCDPNAGGDGSAISENGCVLYANALSESGRTSFQGCVETAIAQGTCAHDIVACADDIRH